MCDLLENFSVEVLENDPEIVDRHKFAEEYGLEKYFEVLRGEITTKDDNINIRFFGTGNDKEASWAIYNMTFNVDTYKLTMKNKSFYGVYENYDYTNFLTSDIGSTFKVRDTKDIHLRDIKTDEDLSSRFLNNGGILIVESCGIILLRQDPSIPMFKDGKINIIIDRFHPCQLNNHQSHLVIITIGGSNRFSKVKSARK